MPEGEEKEQEIGNLSEKIVKENFPNLVKEIDIQVQETHTVPIMMPAKRPTPRHIIIKKPKVKDKERLLKSREKKLPEGCQMGGGRRRMGEQVRGLRRTNRKLQNSHGNIKYSTGNGAAKELIHMTHGHEQWWRVA